MNKKICLFLILCMGLFSCAVFKGVEGVKGNGKVIGGSPSKNIRTDIKRTDKRQKRQYKREMKKRRKRLGSKPPKK